MPKPFPIYSNNLIGRMLSFGGDHTVYCYGQDKVIKFSLIESLLGSRGLQKTEGDYLLIKKTFGHYVLDTEFMQSENGKRIGAVQKKLVGHFLTKYDLNHPYINEQFRQIYELNNELLNSNYPPIDFIGRGGILNECLSNIMVDENNKLIIFDTTLMEISGAGAISWILFPLIFLAQIVNRRRLQSFYNFCLKVNANSQATS